MQEKKKVLNTIGLSLPAPIAFVFTPLRNFFILTTGQQSQAEFSAKVYSSFNGNTGTAKASTLLYTIALYLAFLQKLDTSISL